MQHKEEKQQRLRGVAVFFFTGAEKIRGRKNAYASTASTAAKISS